MIDDQQMRDALDRIARTSDGQLLYRYLQKVLCGVISSSDDSALREDNGRRRFASELMGLMAEGISDSDRAITFSVSGARAVAKQRGAARRVTLDTAVAGWDTESGPASGGSA